VTGVPATVFAVQAGSASVRQAAGTATGLGVVPKPVSARTGSGQFTLTRNARIVASPGANAVAGRAVAGDLAAYLRPSTGYRLPTVIGTPRPGDIALEIGDPGTLGPSHRAEGYQLVTTTSGVKIEAPTAHGLYNGIQRFRQLLPA
jgi:hexosaminidase